MLNRGPVFFDRLLLRVMLQNLTLQTAVKIPLFQSLFQEKRNSTAAAKLFAPWPMTTKT
jgi:hypothetical protein